MMTDNTNTKTNTDSSPYPLGSYTWVPANSYNYIDIYAGNRCGESPERVLENPKLINQKKVLIDIKKRKKKKKRANHYDELCLQYQYGQEWLDKRAKGREVRVTLTKSELKVTQAPSSLLLLLLLLLPDDY